MICIFNKLSSIIACLFGTATILSNKLKIAEKVPRMYFQSSLDLSLKQTITPDATWYSMSEERLYFE